MGLAVLKGIAPSYWASYLVNGDGSGLDGAEQQTADKFRAWLLSGDPRGSIVSCEDAGFRHSHDATRFGVLAADCQEYAALVEESRCG